jgi:uncharacterized protein (DUF2062 family)
MRWLAGSARVLGRVEGSPARVAAAFGIGVFLAFFPVLGIHTGLALGIAVLFRLSKVAILAGAWINNPWTIAPLYGAGTLLGCALLGVAPMSPSAVDWSLSGRAFYSSLGTTLAPLLWPFVIGNLVLGAVGGLVGFIVLKAVLERRRQTAATVDAP